VLLDFGHLAVALGGRFELAGIQALADAAGGAPLVNVAWGERDGGRVASVLALDIRNLGHSKNG